VAYFTAIFPYVVLVTLLIQGLTLPGAIDGVIFFVKPQWEKLLHAEVWYAAVTQAFFSLSVSFGVLIMFASYNPFQHNVYRDAMVVSVMDTLTSLLAEHPALKCALSLIVDGPPDAPQINDILSGFLTARLFCYPYLSKVMERDQARYVEMVRKNRAHFLAIRAFKSLRNRIISGYFWACLRTGRPEEVPLSMRQSQSYKKCSFTIFSILGNLAHETGAERIEDVVQGGAGLAFISYPEAISKFKTVPQ
ncbi:unnamed protein product, partial [Cyprideis torosa]